MHKHICVCIYVLYRCMYTVCVCIDLKPTKSIMRLEEEILREVRNRIGNGVPIIRKQKGTLTVGREGQTGDVQQGGSVKGGKTENNVK